MKNPHFLFIPVLFLFSASAITAQDLHLKLNDKVKTIPAGSYIQVELPNQNEANCKRCQLNLISGKLISVNSDEIEIRLQESKENIVGPAGNVGYSFKKYTKEADGPVIKIAKSDILSIVDKGRKKLYPMHPGDIVGDAMIRLGLIGMFVTSFGDDRPDWVLVSSGLALIGGTIVESIFYQPFYKTNERSGLRKGMHKVWTLS